MAAHADDLRYFYAETLGDTLILSASNTSSATPALAPGRYRVRYRNVSGAAQVWLRQGNAATITAAAAVPSTPFDLGGAASGELFLTMVRGNSATGGLDDGAFLAAITNAGTVDVVVTKISRGKR